MAKTSLRYRCARLQHREPDPRGALPLLRGVGDPGARDDPPRPSPMAPAAGRARPIPLAEAPPETRIGSGLEELDRGAGRRLAGGRGWCSWGGEPGVGKSTLLLQSCCAMAEQGVKVLYVSGEESASQLALRAPKAGSVRLGAGAAVHRRRGGGSGIRKRTTGSWCSTASRPCGIREATGWARLAPAGAAPWRSGSCPSPRATGSPRCWWVTSPSRDRSPGPSCWSTWWTCVLLFWGGAILPQPAAPGGEEPVRQHRRAGGLRDGGSGVWLPSWTRATSTGAASERPGSPGWPLGWPLEGSRPLVTEGAGPELSLPLPLTPSAPPGASR